MLRGFLVRGGRLVEVVGIECEVEEISKRSSKTINSDVINQDKSGESNIHDDRYGHDVIQQQCNWDK